MINTIRNTIQNTIRNTLGDDAFNMLNLFSGGQRGVWYDPSDLATMFQESGDVPTLFVPVGSDKFVTSDGLNFMVQSKIAVTANGQPVGLMLDKSGNTTDASQPVATKRPTYKDTPDRLEIDLIDDALLFDVPLGGIDGYMVIGTNDGTASYGVSLPAGSYELGGDFFPSNTISGFLLREGSVSQSDLSKVESYFIANGAKASYGDVTNFTSYWRGKNITEFPLIDTSSGTDFSVAWQNNNLTSFPLINTSNGTNFGRAWFGNNLTSFPLINTSNGTNFSYAWYGNNLTSFPLINTSNGTNFSLAWTNNNLTSFSLINTSNGTNFSYAWYGNSLTSFPLINTSNGTNFESAWQNNSTLADFPANMFDNCLATNFTNAFLSTGLTQASIDGILVSIESNGTINGTFGQSGGSAPSTTGQTAIDAMRSRGWTITVTGGY